MVLFRDCALAAVGPAHLLAWRAPSLPHSSLLVGSDASGSLGAGAGGMARMQKWFSIRFFPEQQSAKRPSRADSTVQTLAVCSKSCREGRGMCRAPRLPELLLGLGSWFGMGSSLSYLLLHAVLSHRVTALGGHLGSVLGQGEKVLEGSSGNLLSQRGQVAGEHREGVWGSGARNPLPRKHL